MKRILLTLAITALFVGSTLAQEETHYIPHFEFLTGYGKADLHEKGNYQLVPLIIDINYDLKPLTKKIGLEPRSLLQFQLEPFVSPIFNPDANVEMGNAFMVKIGILPDTSKIQPYIKMGMGMLYMTQHTREQSTQFNFLEQGVVGTHIFINKTYGVNLECRFRHVSNSGIDHPNHGINTLFALAGVTYNF
jgi:hypothetical protein